MPVRLKEKLFDLSVKQGSKPSLLEPTFSKLVASLFQALYDNHSFARIVLPKELAFDRESRLKILHRIHSAINPRVTEASFASYLFNAPQKVHIGPQPQSGPSAAFYQSLQFSEEYLLLNCFNKLPNLRY